MIGFNVMGCKVHVFRGARVGRWKDKLVFACHFPWMKHPYFYAAKLCNLPR